MLIDSTYFIGELNIPNSDSTAVADRISWFVAKYEPEFLKSILGYDLYAAFIAGLAEEEVATKWTDLLNGKVYQYADKTVEWKGIIETIVAPVDAIEDTPAVPGQYQSMIANYVYYRYARSVATQSTGIGEVKTNAENATNQSSEQKMVSAWNEMIDKINAMVCFLDANYLDYPEWQKQNRYLMCKAFRKINLFGI